MVSNYFDLKNNGTSFNQELVAGVTAFLAVSYIILLNPAILSEAGMSSAAVLTSTILVSAFSSILMGWYSNNPLLAAPGMSINSLFVAVVVRSNFLSYQTALGCIFWAPSARHSGRFFFSALYYRWCQR